MRNPYSRFDSEIQWKEKLIALNGILTTTKYRIILIYTPYKRYTMAIKTDE